MIVVLYVSASVFKACTSLSDARDVFTELSFYFLTLCSPVGETGKTADRGYKKEMRPK